MSDEARWQARLEERRRRALTSPGRERERPEVREKRDRVLRAGFQPIGSLRSSNYWAHPDAIGHFSFAACLIALDYPERFGLPRGWTGRKLDA